jgi:hypothetical protein
VERFGGEIDYPCLLKPCHSHRFHASFRRKVFVIETQEELLARYQEIAAAGLEVMIQELIPGNDTNGVNYNCYFWDGRPLVEFTSAKIRHAWPQQGQEGIYWLDPYRDIGYGIKYYRQEQYKVSELIGPYFKPHVFATLDIKDPKPALLRIMHMLKKVTMRRGRKLLMLPRRLFRRSKRILLGAKA